MSFPRYEQYKDSGVEWLGEVPEHWERTKLRRLSTTYSGGTPDKTKLEYWDDGTIPWLSSGEVNQSLISKPSTFITEEAFRNSSAKWIPSGALVMALAGQGKTKGTVAQLAIPSTCNQSMAAIVPREMSQARFLFWWLGANYQNIRNMAGGDLRDGLNLELVGNIDCPVVPESERMLIAKFLDQETAKIDALIEEQRRLIELLKEKRQAVISHAVSKGLHPDAPTKDSGIEWMGHVPSHWAIMSLGRVTVLACDGPFGSGLKSDHYSDVGVRVIRLQNIRDGKFDGTDCAFIDPNHYASLGDHDVHGGDLLIAGLGDDRHAVGRACVAPYDIEPAMVKADCFRFRLALEAVPEFIAAQLSIGAPTDAGRLATGSTRSRIPVSKMSSRTIALPEISEQVAVVDYLHRRESEFADLRWQAELSVRLLEERRSALISAAVTGKIDVRTYMAKPVMSATQYSSGFAHQLLAAEILDRCNSPRMGRIKLQKMIHLCEYHGQVNEIRGDYSRKAAGPFDAKAMVGVRNGLKKQRWFEEVKDGDRYRYEPLEKRGEHKKYLAHWESEMPRVGEVLNLLGNAKTRQCEIVSTLYAAWNDLLIDERATDDGTILHEASSAERWHKSKEKIEASIWKTALQWMKDKDLIPVGYGKHTRQSAEPREGSAEATHEPA